MRNYWFLLRGKFTNNSITMQIFNTKKVGVTGFEPATTWSQTRRATGLRYTPITAAKLRTFSELYKNVLVV